MIIIVIITPTINPTLELEELGWIGNEVWVKDAVRVEDDDEKIVDTVMTVVLKYVSSVIIVWVVVVELAVMVVVVAISEARTIVQPE